MQHFGLYLREALGLRLYCLTTPCRYLLDDLSHLPSDRTEAFVMASFATLILLAASVVALLSPRRPCAACGLVAGCALVGVEVARLPSYVDRLRLRPEETQCWVTNQHLEHQLLQRARIPKATLAADQPIDIAWESAEQQRIAAHLSLLDMRKRGFDSHCRYKPWEAGNCTVAILDEQYCDGLGARGMRIAEVLLMAAARNVAVSCSLWLPCSGGSAVVDPLEDVYCHLAVTPPALEAHWQARDEFWWRALRCWRTNPNEWLRRTFGCSDAPPHPEACSVPRSTSAARSWPEIVAWGAAQASPPAGAPRGKLARKTPVTGPTPEPVARSREALRTMRAGSPPPLARLTRCGYEAGRVNLAVHLRHGDTVAGVQEPQGYGALWRLVQLLPELHLSIFTESRELAPRRLRPHQQRQAGGGRWMHFDETGPRLLLRTANYSVARGRKAAVAGHTAALDGAKSGPLSRIRLLVNTEPTWSIDCMAWADGLLVAGGSFFSITAMVLSPLGAPVAVTNDRFSQCFRGTRQGGCESIKLLHVLEPHRFHTLCPTCSPWDWAGPWDGVNDSAWDREAFKQFATALSHAARARGWSPGSSRRPS